MSSDRSTTAHRGHRPPSETRRDGGAEAKLGDHLTARIVNRYGHPMLLSRRAARRAYGDLVRTRSS